MEILIVLLPKILSFIIAGPFFFFTMIYLLTFETLKKRLDQYIYSRKTT